MVATVLPTNGSSVAATPGLGTVTSPSYRAMSLCLHDLQSLPLEVRPDSVKICFGQTPAYTIHVDEGTESPNPEFRSTPKVLASDLTVYFEYLVYSEIEAACTSLLSQVVFQRDAAGNVVTDNLLDIFSYTPAPVSI